MATWMSNTKAFVSEVPALEQYGHYFDRLLEKKNMSCLKRRGITCKEVKRSLRSVVKPLKSWTMQMLFSNCA